MSSDVEVTNHFILCRLLSVERWPHMHTHPTHISFSFCLSLTCIQNTHKHTKTSCSYCVISCQVFAGNHRCSTLDKCFILCVCVDFFYHILYIKEIGHWGIQQWTHTNQRMTPPHHQTFVSSNYLLLAHILSDPIIFLTI